MSSVRPTLLSYSVNRDGKAPICLQVTQRKQRPQKVLIGHTVPPAAWDKKQRRVMARYYGAGQINHDISTMRGRLESALLRPTKIFSLEELYEIAGFDPDIQPEKPDFYAWAETYRERFNNESQFDNYKRLGTRINFLKEFAPTPLPWEKITLQFFKGYEAHLKRRGTRKGSPMKINTVRAEMKQLCTWCNSAEEERIIKPEQNPAHYYRKPKPERVKKPRLTQGELAALRKVEVEPGTRNFHAKNAFLLQFNFRGIRFHDLCTLKWNDFTGDRLELQANKDGDIFSVKLTREAQEILSHYRPAVMTREAKNDYVMPFLKGERKIKKQVGSWNAHINKALKDLADFAHIDKNLTTHMARHTWAQRILDAGAGPKLIQKGLGHSDLATTDRYLADFGDKDLDQINELITAEG